MHIWELRKLFGKTYTTLLLNFIRHFLFTVPFWYRAWQDLWPHSQIKHIKQYWYNLIYSKKNFLLNWNQQRSPTFVMFKQLLKLLNDTLHLEQCNERILVTSDPLDLGWTCFIICMTIFHISICCSKRQQKWIYIDSQVIGPLADDSVSWIGGVGHLVLKDVITSGSVAIFIKQNRCPGTTWQP